MASPAHPRRLYQFGPFRLDATNRVLLREGEIVPLSPVVAETLLVLVENHRNLVNKEDLLKAVWPDTFVEEGSLTHNISVLRKVLGEDPGEQRFIQTVPKRGYRFVAAVSRVEELPTTGPPPPADAQRLKLEVLRQQPLTRPTAVRRHAWALVLAAIAAVIVVSYLRLRPTGDPTLKNATFTQLTDQPGQELYPSLSPDGNSFVYASKVSGNWDIYLQRVGGKAPISLTMDSTSDDTQPAFSPDGARIAFRSERDGGGIFLMGATGESVRRITDFGYNPAWSPDGQQIVCATVSFQRPDYRPFLGSRLFAVDVVSGEKRPLAELADDAVQPQWSPKGSRIAYWANRDGSRDISTVSIRGGDPVPVTRDTALDWNPVWSPDGKYLYFSSNRGGSMNLWRAPMDEESGKVLGPPEPVTTPSPYSGYISFSRDGRRIAYVQQVRTVNLERIAFDPVTEQPVGQPEAITAGLKILWGPMPSSDGKWVAFSSGGGREDLFVMRADGSGMRQLTDDPYVDRQPEWSPDDKRIAFTSTRSGKYEIWVINADGSGLQQLTHWPGAQVVGPVWSPDGAWLACTRLGGDPLILEVSKRWADQHPEALPPIGRPDVHFAPRSWSPDGKTLAGHLRRERLGTSSGLAVYSFADRTYQHLAEFGAWSRWLSDSRRLVFHDNGKIHLIDSQSRRVREIHSAAPHDIEVNANLGISRDDRRIYFCLTKAEADIWSMSVQ